MLYKVILTTVALALEATAIPAPGSPLVLHSCAPTSGQSYYVNPSGYPFKQVLRNAYTSPVPLCWTVNATGTGGLGLEVAARSSTTQEFNFTSAGRFVSMNTGLCISYSSLSLGADLSMSPCDPSAASQVFIYDSTADGHVVAGHSGSNLCVDSL